MSSGRGADCGCGFDSAVNVCGLHRREQGRRDRAGEVPLLPL